MAITDNLAIRIKAESGQTVITDNIGSLAVSTGAGTVTNVNDGTHGQLWRLNGGANRSADISGLGLGNWSELGTGVTKVTTFAIRFRTQNRQAAWLRYSIVGTDGNNGLGLINTAANATSLQGISCVGGGTARNLNTLPSYTAGQVETIVFRMTVTNGYDCTAAAWFGGVTRTGVLPNSTNYNGNLHNTKALALLNFAAGTTETLDILDYALWNRGLTDAEAAAVADDMRTAVYVAASVPDGSIPSGTGAGTGSGTGGEASGGSGTSATATGGTGAGAGSGSGGSATGGLSGTPSITIPEIKDLTTGALRASATGITVIINDLTSGELVVKKTGLSTDVSGNCVVADALLAAATTYRVTTILSDGSEGTWKYAAA